jgi:hypothetical protein
VLAGNAAPDLSPEAALNCMEILDFHGTHAALAHEAEMPLQVENLDAVVGACQKATREFFAFRCRFAGEFQLELAHDSLGEGGKRLSLLFNEATRACPVVENAEHPEWQALPRSERNSCVETYVWLAFDTNPVLKARVTAQIRNDKKPRLQKHMIAD